MACFTTEYGLHTGNALAVDSCRIGQDIWVVQRSPGYYFKMFKWNIDTNQWYTVDFKNRGFIEYYNGLAENIKDFAICSSDGKLYMWREESGGSVILEFNPITLEWARLRVITWKPVSANFLILNNEVYGSTDNRKIKVLPLDALSADVYSYLREGDERSKLDFCKMDGVTYFIHIVQNGGRNVVKLIRETEGFYNVNKYDEPRDYLVHSGSGEYQTSTYGYNTKIYQVVQSANRIILDCFDTMTVKFHTIFDTKHTDINVINIFGDDQKAYLVYSRNGYIGIRVIDLMPTLETLSLIRVADNRINGDIRDIIPYGLRLTFDNMVKWRNDLKKMNPQQ